MHHGIVFKHLSHTVRKGQTAHGPALEFWLYITFGLLLATAVLGAAAVWGAAANFDLAAARSMSSTRPDTGVSTGDQMVHGSL